MALPIYDVNVDGTYVDFKYKGTCQDAANLRNQIKYNIHSYLIDKITYHHVNMIQNNTKTLEFLSLRFGQLILDNHGVNDESVGSLEISGPIMVTANHIKGLTFVHDSPIVYLRKGESLTCDLHVKRDCGKTHEKWNPVSCITFNNEDHDIFHFSFELIGIISVEDMIAQLNN